MGEMIMFTRRRTLGFLTATVAAGASSAALAELGIIDKLLPGQFTWNTEKAPTGALAIVVSLPDQRVYVYCDGIRMPFLRVRRASPVMEPPQVFL